MIYTYAFVSRYLQYAYAIYTYINNLLQSGCTDSELRLLLHGFFEENQVRKTFVLTKHTRGHLLYSTLLLLDLNVTSIVVPTNLLLYSNKCSFLCFNQDSEVDKFFLLLPIYIIWYTRKRTTKYSCQIKTHIIVVTISKSDIFLQKTNIRRTLLNYRKLIMLHITAGYFFRI